MATSDYNLATRAKIESFEYLDQILRYDPVSGDLIWKVLFPDRIAGAVITGKGSRTSYRKLALERLDFKAHRLCWILAYGKLPPEGAVIDHIDGNGLNNALSNLRACSQRMNSRNSKTPVSNTSGFKGVRSLAGTHRFQAYICVDRQQIHLGMYDTKEEAYSAYCDAAKTHFGEYARLDEQSA
jgi:hypothetical protein